MTAEPPADRTEPWRPRTGGAMLRARAELLGRIRGFFAERGVLEVETPILAHSAPSDPHLESFAVPVPPNEWYLQSSPEFAMKRLLADGAGPIYQLCKAFRREEEGRYHNVEFTMLEWYRPGYTLDALMDEVAALVVHCIGDTRIERKCYRDLFSERVGLDPHLASVAELRGRVESEPRLRGVALAPGDGELARGQALDLLFSHLVAPRLADAQLVFDYPACQAVLARTAPDASGVEVARRFELYIDGVELANGYHELLDPEELASRIDVDNRQRAALGRAAVDRDEMLLAAMAAGLPDCSGVALGVDRLLMVATGARSISEVISFPARDFRSRDRG